MTSAIRIVFNNFPTLCLLALAAGCVVRVITGGFHHG